MKRLVILAVLPLLLSACTVPTVAVVAVAVDGVTFMGSGKSITSHTMTAVTHKDCSFLYGFTRGKFCKKKEKFYDHTTQDAGFVLPSNRPVVAENPIRTPVEPKSMERHVALEPRFFDFDYETDPAIVAKATLAEEKNVTSTVDMPAIGQKQWTLVLGTFTDFSRANDLASKIQPDPGLITTLVVAGKTHYRVSTRPLRRDQAVGPELSIAALNLKKVKLMPVCAMGVRTADCVALDRVLSGQQATLQ